jgi:hypothetical protein
MMAHFAQLDDNNVVTQVIAVANEELLDNGVESEDKGIAFCQSLFSGNWKQTSYNNNIRVRYAGIGYTYDAERDAFIESQPYPSWVLNEELLIWDSPVAMPDDGKKYYWDETTTNWIEVTNPTI